MYVAPTQKDVAVDFKFAVVPLIGRPDSLSTFVLFFVIQLKIGKRFVSN